MNRIFVCPYYILDIGNFVCWLCQILCFSPVQRPNIFSFRCTVNRFQKLCVIGIFHFELYLWAKAVHFPTQIVNRSINALALVELICIWWVKHVFAELIATFLLRSLRFRAPGATVLRKSPTGLRPGRFSPNLRALRPPAPLTTQKVAINQQKRV